MDGIRVEKLEYGLKGVSLLEICIFYEYGLRVKLCAKSCARYLWCAFRAFGDSSEQRTRPQKDRTNERLRDEAINNDIYQ